MPSKAMILVALRLAAFVVNLDTTLVNVALPDLVREAACHDHLAPVGRRLLQPRLRCTAAHFRKPVRPVRPQGHAARRAIGVRRREPAGGFTTTAVELIVARSVMGLGAAMTFPSTLSLIANVFTSRKERAQAIGLWGAIAGAAIAMGPIVGGWLLEHFSWTSIFTAMAPVAGVAAVLFALVVPASRAPEAPAPDVPGLVLSSAVMALLVFTIIEAPTYGWTAARSAAGFAASESCSWHSSRLSGAPRTRCSTCGCSATCGSAQPAVR